MNKNFFSTLLRPEWRRKASPGRAGTVVVALFVCTLMSCTFIGELGPCKGPSDLTGASMFWFEIHDTLGNNLLDYRKSRYDLNRTYLQGVTAKGQVVKLPVQPPGKFTWAFYDWDEKPLVPFGKLTTQTYYVHFSDGDVDTVVFQFIPKITKCYYDFSSTTVTYNGVVQKKSSPFFIKKL